MRIIFRLGSLWNTLFRKEALDRDLDDELRASVATLTARYVRDGMGDEAARRAAIAALGAVDHIKDEVRSARIGAGLDALFIDARYAWRSLWNARGLTATIVLTLALGIGANTAIFSVVHAMLLSPLPYRDPDRLVFLWLGRGSASFLRGPFSGPDLRDLRERTRSFEALGGIWASGTIALTREGTPEQIRFGFVTANFFDVLGAESALGRTFRPEDSMAGAEPAILIGWELFERRFGADRSIVGRKIHVDDHLATVVGVMPKDFRLLLPPDASVPDHLQAWIPFWPKLENGPRRNLFLRIIGRMRPGVSVSEAREDVASVARAANREAGTNRMFTAVALHADDVREMRGPLIALFAGVAILLMIACVNVASLLIARAATRARETALRLALGASRGRLVRQSLMEGLLLTLLGAVAGVLVGYVGLRLLIALTPPSLSRLTAARIDTPVLAFTLGSSIVWGLLFSLAPLAELFKFDGRKNAGAHALQPHWRTTTTPVRYRTRAVLVTAQIALSLVLLVSASLLARAFSEILRVDVGFDVDRQLTFRLTIPGRYESTDAFNSFTDQLHQRLAAIPGVNGVGTISHLPYDDLPNWAFPYSLTSPITPDALYADARAISAGLFETLGVRLLEGRFFTNDDDDPKNPVVIVDDAFAERLWPNQSAVGRQFVANYLPSKVTVVGVVRHLRLRSLVDHLAPQIYVPWRLAQRNPTAYVIAADRDPGSLTADVRAAIASLDPHLPIYDARPLGEYVQGARSLRRFTMRLAGAFALSALVLTCVGVYGVLAYAVSHRRHEIGVRRALGAATDRLVREVLGEGVRFTVIGCACGLAGATVAARFLESQLYAIRPDDPLSYAAAVLLTAIGGIVACALPAHRAATISPMDALRSE
jgi:putative ABC transport system permease protein